MVHALMVNARAASSGSPIRMTEYVVPYPYGPCALAFVEAHRCFSAAERSGAIVARLAVLA